MNNRLPVTKITGNLRFGVALLAGALIFGFATIPSSAQQSSNYTLQFEQSSIVLEPNSQTKVPIIVSNASDQNAVSIQLLAAGDVEILDIVGSPGLLSIAKQLGGQTARIDVAKQQYFSDREIIASVTLSNNGESGNVRFAEGSSVNGISSQTLGISVQSLEYQESNQPDLPQVIDEQIQNTVRTPGLLLIALMVTILLLVLCIWGIVELNKKSAKDAF